MKLKTADIVMLFSVLTVVISGVVSVGQIELWLAGTQWILIGIVLGIYGIFLKMEKG